MSLINKQYKYIIIVMIQFLCMFFQFSTIGILLFLLICLYGFYDIIVKRNLSNIFLFLILISSYHSNFPNIYTVNFFNISIIYFMFIFFALTTIKNIFSSKFNINYILLILPLLLLLPYHLIYGFINKFSNYAYITESVSFLIFYFFILYALTNNKEKNNEILDLVKTYIIIYYPLFVIFSGLLFPSNSNLLFYDEFSKFHALAFTPIIIFSNYKLNHKVLLLLLNILSFFIIAITGYLSTLNLILITISYFIILLKLNFRIIIFSLVFFILLFFSSYKLLIKYGNETTIWKVKQVGLTITNFNFHNINQIPRSPKVRILEIMNSYNELSDSPLLIVIGKGFGSYFTDTKYSFKNYGVDLSKGDVYSLDQVKQSKYYIGHGFISYSLIKWGFSGILIISLISFLIFFIKTKDFFWLSISVPLYVLTTFGYGLKNFIMIGFFIGISLILIIKKL